MYAFIAFIPIIFAVIVMAGFNWPAKRAMPIAWLIAAVLCLLVWKVSFFESSVAWVGDFTPPNNK